VPARLLDLRWEFNCRLPDGPLESASSVKTLVAFFAFAVVGGAQLVPAAEPLPAGGTPFEISAGEHFSVRENPEPTPNGAANGNTLQQDANRAVTTVTPAAPGAGLIIDATFDSSITSSPNAAAIESAINAAISQLQSLFSDPIRVSILFRYATSTPNGTPMQSTFVA
jgi:hypothetical protein